MSENPPPPTTARAKVPFAMGRLDSSIPQEPLLKIEGYDGTVELPVNEKVANEIGQLMEAAPYGMGKVTVVDKDVRDTLQLGPDKFKITNEEFSQAILTVVKTVKLELGLHEMEVWAELNNLLLYKPGGHFKPHTDREKMDGMFGTLIVQLPSEFTGGDLVVRYDGKEVLVKMSQEGSSTSCLIAAHYSDCEHEITPVLTGYRMALVYSLCWGGAGQAPSAQEMLDKADELDIDNRRCKFKDF